MYILYEYSYINYYTHAHTAIMLPTNVTVTRATHRLLYTTIVRQLASDTTWTEITTFTMHKRSEHWNAFFVRCYLMHVPKVEL